MQVILFDMPSSILYCFRIGIHHQAFELSIL